MNKSASDSENSKIYFPLTANPVGYNHLLLAETILWQLPESKLIVFLISNGYHPDPLKRTAIPNSQLRFEILIRAIRDWANLEKSIPAQIASEYGIILKLQNNNCVVSRSELSLNTPVHLADNIKLFSKSGRVKFIVGADLINRMLNHNIFSAKDLDIISKESHLQIAPRNEIEIEKVLEKLKEQRGVSFKYNLIRTEILPQKLQKFFLISSTIIRKAVQAEHDLKIFLPSNAGKQIIQNNLYINGKTLSREESSDFNELKISCFELIEKLEESAKALLKLLNNLESKKKPHKFSIVETSTGGKISESFINLPGASNHFIDGRILYSKEVQTKFIEKSFSKESSVSKTMAMHLAERMYKTSGADWALAETGMLGPPSKDRRSEKSGQCYIALALNKKIQYKFFEFNPFLSRKEHQLIFAIEAFKWAINVLQN